MVDSIRLQNFRSFKDATFEFDKKVNIIVGPNASGKTNLLEAVQVVAEGGSYRVRDQELIRFNKPWARLESFGSANQRIVKIITEPTPSKQFELDKKPLKRMSLDNKLPVVLFEPNNLRIFSAGPERRRDYLDEVICKTTAGYATTLRQYKRALNQRNSLLKKSVNINEAVIFPWNVRLSQLAGQIVRAREELAAEIDNEIGKLYRKLSSSRTKINLVYGKTWPVEDYESKFLRKLESSLVDDQQRGFTSSGPHREDVLLSFNGVPVQNVASRGEVRTAVLALKIIELEVVKRTRNQQPILLLDDVFSELDGKRRHALTDYLSKYQAFITTTDADIVLQYFTDKCKVIPLGRG